MNKKFLILPAILIGLHGLQAQISKPLSSTKKFSAAGKKLIVYTTADSSNFKLSVTDTLSFTELAQPKETQICVFVDPAKTFQSFIGIGAAITDASAEVFAKLPKETQDEFLTAYYDAKKGIGYNFARTNIASCDFSSDTYGYVADKDSLLTTFSVTHDEKFRIPLLKQAIAAAGGTLPLFVSPFPALAGDGIED